MKDFLYGVDLSVTLADGTKETGVTLSFVNKKRVYAKADGTELIGDKAVASIEEQTIIIHPALFIRLARFEVKK